MRLSSCSLAGILGASAGQVICSARTDAHRRLCHGPTKDMLTDWEQVFGWITSCEWTCAASTGARTGR